MDVPQWWTWFVWLANICGGAPEHRKLLHIPSEERAIHHVGHPRGHCPTNFKHEATRMFLS